MIRENEYHAYADHRPRHLRVATAANFPVPTQQETNFTYVPLPWKKVACAWCETDVDCRSSAEYCDVNGCCQQGQCKINADCEEFDAQAQYYPIRGFDSWGNDSNTMHPQDDPVLAREACDANPDCMAYTSYGYLKHTVQPPQFWDAEPPIDGLPPWTMYLKKSAVDHKDSQMQLSHGIKSFCHVRGSEAHDSKEEGEGSDGRTGVCRQCLACTKDGECPTSTVCDQGCCVNNPCYTATPEDGEWVDGRYTRGLQCACPDGEKYCCLADRNNVHSAYCSNEPCSDHFVQACAYMCEDPDRLFDAVMCRGNERCCNDSPGGPVCCAPGTDCDAAAKTNACQDGEMKKCAALPGFQDIMCFSTQTCCNEADAPPVCCDGATCVAGKSNACNYQGSLASTHSDTL
jgi:hypothetical protein